MVHKHYMEEAILLIRAGALENKSADPDTTNLFKRWGFAGSEKHPVLHWPEFDHFPEFQDLTGASCGVWRLCAYNAALFGQPMSWSAYQTVIGGKACVIEHAISPFGPGCLLGSLQYFPTEIQYEPLDAILEKYGEMPTGIYVFGVNCSFLYRVIHSPFSYSHRPFRPSSLTDAVH